MSLLTFARTNSLSAYYNRMKYDSSDSNFKSKLIRSLAVLVYILFSYQRLYLPNSCQ